MKQVTQRETNPFKNSDSNKRYYTYDYYLRKTYGGKCAKVTLDAGFTCPNIDGTKGYSGCIYCSSRGGGDFAPEASLSLAEQYELQVARITEKWDTPRFIPYLQAHTNTYGELSRLRAVYRDVLMLPNAVALHIATRADCLGDGVLDLLAEVAETLPLTVELGLQTVKDDVAKRIGRGHTYREFLDGYTRLRARVPSCRIAIHIINGLPTETKEDMLETVKAIAALSPDEVKIHLLHVLRGTPLATLYEEGRYTPQTREEYVDTVVEQLRLLPPDTVIGRLTGDGKAEDLLAPAWSLKKLTVINEIDKKMAKNGFLQGDLYNLNKNII